MPFQVPPWLDNTYQRNSRIPALLLEQGRVQAEGANRSGAIWGSTVANLGGIVGQGVERYAEEKKAEKLAQLEKIQNRAFLDLYQKTEGNPSPMALIQLYGPERAMKVYGGVQAARELARKEGDADLALLPKLVAGMDAAPESLRAQLYPETRALVLKAYGGRIKPEVLPEQYDPEFWQTQARPLLKGLVPGKEEEGYTLNPGDKRFKGEKVIAENAPRPAAPPNVGSFEDYVVRKFGAQPTPEQIAQARKEYQQADDRPYRDPVPVVILTDKGPQLVDRKTGTAAPIKEGGGGTVAPPPTTDQRNREASKERAQPVLDSIQELSERINTKQGLYAKMAGGAAKVAAKANLDDDVAEYQALVASFTPMVARLLGHTGVLTQQDVDSARAILPAPGDSKSLRDRKIERIKKLLGNAGGAAAPGKVGRFTVEVEK